MEVIQYLKGVMVKLRGEPKYKPYSYYLKRRKERHDLKSKGIELIIRKNKVKVFCGVVCLGIAIFPNGLGLICYPMGFMLLGISIIDLKQHKTELLRRVKNKIKRGF